MGIPRYMEVEKRDCTYVRSDNLHTIREMQCHLYALRSAYRVISVCQYYGYHLAARVFFINDQCAAMLLHQHRCLQSSICFIPSTF